MAAKTHDPIDAAAAWHARIDAPDIRLAVSDLAAFAAEETGLPHIMGRKS